MLLLTQFQPYSYKCFFFSSRLLVLIQVVEKIYCIKPMQSFFVSQFSHARM